MELLAIVVVVVVALWIAKSVSTAAQEKERREEAERREAEREMQRKRQLDDLQKSPTMGILRNLESIPLSSWRSAGQRTGRDGEGTYTILVFRTRTQNGVPVELHRCWYNNSYNHGDWGHAFVDGTEIPRTAPFTGVIDALSSRVEHGYNKPDSGRMDDLLNKM